MQGTSSSFGAANVLTDQSGRRYALVPLADDQPGDRDAETSASGATLPAHLLTPRETEIALHVVRGRSNKHIAAMCGITEGTVKTYVHRLFRKLGAASRVELVLRLQEELEGRGGRLPSPEGD